TLVGPVWAYGIGGCGLRSARDVAAAVICRAECQVTVGAYRCACEGLVVQRHGERQRYGGAAVIAVIASIGRGRDYCARRRAYHVVAGGATRRCRGRRGARCGGR